MILAAIGGMAIALKSNMRYLIDEDFLNHVINYIEANVGHRTFMEVNQILTNFSKIGKEDICPW